MKLSLEESESPSVNVSSLCRAVKMSTANWYKGRRQRQRKKVDESLVAELVKRERKTHPRMGGRKLLDILSVDFTEAGVSIGRDRFFDVLRRNGLLVPPLPKSCKTTNSRHSLEVFHNLVKDVRETAANEVWVSDITYIRTENDWAYLSLITDRFSRKIVGWHCSRTLESMGCVKALEKAVSEMPEGASPIHHSDRGCQYCCHEYVNLLHKHGFSISMTETNHCAENSHAERVNGTLKTEYGLAATFNSFEQAGKAAAQAIWIYNNLRPHSSLGYRKPAEVHRLAS